MPNRTYRVRVMLPETPERKKYVESPAHGFTVQARTHDAAATVARARAVANALVVRTVSHSPDRVITLLAQEPKTMAVRA